MPRAAVVFMASAIALLLPWTAAASAAAQGVGLGAVRGVVTDSAGAPVPDARVEVRHAGTGARVVAFTDREGRYHVANIDPGGPYTVRASRIGYAAAAREDVYLQAGGTLRLDFELRAEAVLLPGVAVRAAEDAFDATRTGAATVIERQRVDALPTVSRNVADLATLSPMTATTEEGASVAGQNLRFNTFRIDGALHQDVFGFAAGGVPGQQANAKPIPLHAIEQYQVLVAPFDVRLSGFTGGVMNVVTRRGTNEFAASGFGHFRNQSFLGDLQVDGIAGRPDDFQVLLSGFHVGGPLQRDRAHFFIAGELERRRAPPLGYHLGTADPARVQISADTAAELIRILGERAFDAGEYGVVTLENPIDNLFGRLDWQPDERHRVTLRYNYAGARDDVGPHRQGFGWYGLSSHGFRQRTGSRGLTARLASTLGGGVSNELTLNHLRLHDAVEPASDLPEVEVLLSGVMEADGAHPVSRWVRAGGNPIAHANELDQRILEVRNDLTLALGDHLLTFGAGVESVDIRSLYFPGSRGRWRFNSLDALRDDIPLYYERNLSYTGEDPIVRFSVAHLGGYVQDEWSPVAGLTVRAGLRADLPVIRGTPEENPDVWDAFGVSTATLPSTTPIFSPRVGFNLQLDRRLRTQVRGGAGFFTGRPPFVWLANAYANTGLRTAYLICGPVHDVDARPGIVPGLDAAAPPDRCANGQGLEEIGRPGVAFFAEDFRFPQDRKLALGVDQELPLGLTLTADVVFSKAVRQILVEDINLGPALRDPAPVDGYTRGLGFPWRAAYGEPTDDGFEPVRLHDGFSQVARIGNSSGNASLAASFELNRGFSDRLHLGLAYTFTRAVDRQSLVGRDAAANIGLSPTAGDPNDPDPAFSNFHRPHKLLVAASGRGGGRLSGTELTLLFVRQSGTPYSYVYGSDINGDGYPGPGTFDAYNDLFFIPWDFQNFPASRASTAALGRQMAADPCLARYRGEFVPRNACRTPGSNRLDLRLTQSLRGPAAGVRIVADLLNVLNLLNDDWGRVRHTDPMVVLAEALARDGSDLLLTYSGPIARDPATGTLTGALPYSYVVPASQWQAQIGIEIAL